MSSCTREYVVQKKVGKVNDPNVDQTRMWTTPSGPHSGHAKFFEKFSRVPILDQTRMWTSGPANH